MAQTVCVLLDDATMSQLAGIAGDRSRPLKHILRARIVLLSAERPTVQEAARQAGVSRPAVRRWQQRFAEEGVEGLLRDKTDPPARHPAACHANAGGGAGADLLGAAGRGHPLDRSCRRQTDRDLPALRSADLAGAGLRRRGRLRDGSAGRRGGRPRRAARSGTAGRTAPGAAAPRRPGRCDWSHRSGSIWRMRTGLPMIAASPCRSPPSIARPGGSRPPTFMSASAGWRSCLKLTSEAAGWRPDTSPFRPRDRYGALSKPLTSVWRSANGHFRFRRDQAVRAPSCNGRNRTSRKALRTAEACRTLPVTFIECSATDEDKLSINPSKS